MIVDDGGIPAMRIRPRPGAYACGMETIETILQAALNVLVEEGYKAFTLRRIAAECGLRAGNLSYHFPRKEDLVAALLEAVLNGYRDMTTEMLAGHADDPRERLGAMIGLIMEDIRSKRTTNLFPELWALSNHDAEVAKQIQALYASAHGQIAKAVKAVNPALGDEDCLIVAVFISSTMEGSTIFAGHDKPWEPKMAQLKALAIKSLVHLASTVTADDVRALERQAEPA